MINKTTLGHGGPHTAELLSQNLLQEILESVPLHAPAEVVREKLLAIFDSFDAKILSDFTDNFKHSIQIPIRILRQNYIGTKLGDDNIRHTAGCAKSGSTALVAYIDDGALHLANTGDCRAGASVLFLDIKPNLIIGTQSWAESIIMAKSRRTS
jgi:serine/threonine protein phosphatase PrpC